MQPLKVQKSSVAADFGSDSISNDDDDDIEQQFGAAVNDFGDDWIGWLCYFGAHLPILPRFGNFWAAQIIEIERSHLCHCR